MNYGQYAKQQKQRLRDAALKWANLAAEKQFSGRKGHGGNPMLAERHLSRQELQVLLAAAFEAGAELTGSLLKPAAVISGPSDKESLQRGAEVMRSLKHP